MHCPINIRRKKTLWYSRAKVISLHVLKKGEGRKEMKIKFMPNAFSTTHTKKEHYYEIHYK